jgi:hypothetical protein
VNEKNSSSILLHTFFQTSGLGIQLFSPQAKLCWLQKYQLTNILIRLATKFSTTFMVHIISVNKIIKTVKIELSHKVPLSSNSAL